MRCLVIDSTSLDVAFWFDSHNVLHKCTDDRREVKSCLFLVVHDHPFSVSGKIPHVEEMLN